MFAMQPLMSFEIPTCRKRVESSGVILCWELIRIDAGENNRCLVKCAKDDNQKQINNFLNIIHPESF